VLFVRHSLRLSGLPSPMTLADVMRFVRYVLVSTARTSPGVTARVRDAK